MIKKIKASIKRYLDRLTLLENTVFDTKLELKIVNYKLRRIMQNLEIDKEMD